MRRQHELNRAAQMRYRLALGMGSSPWLTLSKEVAWHAHLCIRALPRLHGVAGLRRLNTGMVHTGVMASAGLAAARHPRHSTSRSQTAEVQPDTVCQHGTDGRGVRYCHIKQPPPCMVHHGGTRIVSYCLQATLCSSSRTLTHSHMHIPCLRRMRRKERQAGMESALEHQKSELQKATEYAKALEVKLAALEAKLSTSSKQQQQQHNSPGSQQQTEQHQEPQHQPAPAQQPAQGADQCTPRGAGLPDGACIQADAAARGDAAAPNRLQYCASIASIQAFVRKHKLPELLRTGGNFSRISWVCTA